ncbi:MAG TPA: APC family permease [Bryobacteraceae bacterium]|nr:APC family permease [Bryobacteraceae bacterium]
MPEPALELKRELGLRDITLFAIACMISTRWISSAAHAGPGSVTLWVLGAALFAFPLAIAVAALIVRHPGTGGIYLWTRRDFGPWHGFLGFWVYWMGIALLIPSAAMFYMSIATYLMGPQYASLGDNRWFVTGASLAAIWIAMWTNIVGMKIGKWTENAGGAAGWALGVLLAVIGAMAWSKHGSATHINIIPSWNFGTVNYWGQIAYGLSGLEMAGFMTGEIRNPEKTFPRAAWIASTFLVIFYVVATLALVILVPAEKISELIGLPQAGAAAAKLLGMPWLPAAIAALVLINAVGVFGGLGSSCSRLPMAAGADHLLPAAFARIHPRWGTPYISLIIFGAVSSGLLIAVQLGDTLRAGYDTLVSLMVLVGFLPYFYIFVGAWKAGKRASVVSGLAVTALVVVLSVVPPGGVNVVVFEGKIALGTLGVIASAWLVYRRSKQ